MITPDERAAVRALADAATAGPWEATQDKCWGETYPSLNIQRVYEYTDYDPAHAGCEPLDAEDVAFIAAARTAVPRLLDALDAAEAEIERLRAFREHLPTRPDRETVLSEWGIDDRDVEAIRGAAAEAAAWTLIDRTSDTFDRAPSAETMQDALRDAPALLPGRSEAEVLAPIRAALANHPTCDVYPDDDPVTCGWKRAVADVQTALDGDHTALRALLRDAWDEGASAGYINAHEHRPGRHMTNPYREGDPT